MREISAKIISRTIKDLCIKANYEISADVLSALKLALKNETSRNGKDVLRDLISNAEIARTEGFPICQDTGKAVVFIDVGQDVRITGGNLEKAINEGVRTGYKEGYLRKSIVHKPFNRKNTEDNTPAAIRYRIVPGNRIRIVLMAKGGGAENKSSSKMFTPTSSREDIIEFVIETVRKAGGEACPPFVIGVGIGGNLEGSAMLSKEALIRKLGNNNPDREISGMEKDLLKRINATGIGPAGLGGSITALSVAIEEAPCHIASLPVTVNMDCHAHRVRCEVI